MKALKCALFVLALVVSGSVAARPEPIVNYDNVALAPPSGKSFSVDEARQLIRRAAETRKWEVSDGQEGKMLVRRMWNNKHVIVAEVSYSATNYSLNYKDSIAMNYMTFDGKPSIHQRYNTFVRELVDGIRLDVMMR